jgi:hypothetical protein
MTPCQAAGGVFVFSDPSSASTIAVGPNARCKVRYMSASGLERKANPEQYVEKVEKRIGASG